jgi:hypothetical protein
MPDFDHYHTWLGISPRDQPPHHYRLLGVDLLEGDADVIEHAADQRMAHVRSFQSGPRADQAQQLLHELTRAKLVLLDPQRKSEYDQQFAAQADSPPGSSALPVAPSPGGDAVSVSTAAATPHPARRSNGRLELVKVILGGVAGIGLAFLLLAYLRRGDEPAPQAKAIDQSTPKPATEDPPVIPPRATEPAPPPVLKPVKPHPLQIAGTYNLPAVSGTPTFAYARCDSGQAAKVLGPCHESFVTVSLVGGQFAGASESFDVDVVEVKGVACWRLSAAGKQSIASAVTAIKSPLRAWFERDVEFREWKAGDKPIQLIHEHDGFAVLSGVTGGLLGPEEVQVHLGADGYWNLSGTSARDTRARAVIYRFKSPRMLRAVVEEHELRPKQNVTTLPFDAAICSVSRVAGSFYGFGEAIHCEVNDRGWWVFQCNGQQLSTSGTVTCIALDVPAIITLVEQSRPNQKQSAPSSEAQATLQTSLASALERLDAREIAALAKDRASDERYVLLQAAIDAAAANGDCAGALSAVKAIAGEYDVDSFDLTMQTLQKLRAGCETAAANRELAKLALTHLDLGTLLDKTDARVELAELALAAALAAKDEELQREATLKLVEFRK